MTSSIKKEEVNKLIKFNYGRAMIERQMGQNQLNCGDEAGQLRIDRAQYHEDTAKCLEALNELAFK